MVRGKLAFVVALLLNLVAGAALVSAEMRDEHVATKHIVKTIERQAPG